jgi:hypothetical protein
MSNDDPLMQRATWLQNTLVERHGQETTTAMLGAIGSVGVDQGALRRIVASDDAVNTFEQLGTEALLRVMQGSPKDPATHAAETAHGNIREWQRQNWRSSHGRR